MYTREDTIMEIVFIESKDQLIVNGKVIENVLFDPETGAYYDEDGKLIATDDLDRSGW